MATPFSTQRDAVGNVPFGGRARVPGVGAVSGEPSLGRPGVGSVPGSTFVTDDNNSQYLWQGRSRVTYAYATRMNHTDQDGPADLNILAANNLLFARQSELTNQHAPGFQSLRTLGALNCFLQSEKGRLEFGKDVSCEKLLQRWRFLGVQQTDTQNQNVYAGRQDAVITLSIAQRVRIPDLWLSTAIVSKPGDVYYLLLMRFEKLQQADMFAAAEQPVANSKVPSTYWQFVPFVSKNKAAPPCRLYASAPGASAWVGTYIKIGAVTDRYNSVEHRDHWIGLASRCVFPPTAVGLADNTKKLPDVELCMRAD